MIEFKRQPSGLYLADPPASARVAFLFQDASRTDPTFSLTAASWTDPNSLGFIAFFVKSGARDWNAFAAAVRSAFTSQPGTQIGWFPEPLTISPVLVNVSGQGTASPMLAQPLSLVFRQSVTFQVQSDIFDPSTTVLFDDASNSIQFGNAQQQPNIFLLNAAVPGGATLTYQSTAPFTSLAMTGPLTGAASVVFQLTTANLTQFEAGMMYFSPPVNGGLVGALNYPVFRGVGGATTPFNFNVTLDVLAPLDPDRTFFQFADPAVGCNYVTANGKPLAFKTVNGGDIGKTSRLVFAGRPVQSPTDQSYYYLTPAGQFAFTPDDNATSAQSGDTPQTVQILCGVTGTEFLSITLGAQLDSIEFTPGMPAYRIPPAADSPTKPVYLDGTAKTSYGTLITAAGAYVSQPERAPLYMQSGNTAAMIAGAAPPSGLDVHLLDYFPLDSWSATQTAPPTPLAPYAGLAFATDPNLNLAQYLDMESAALNPKRADTYLSVPPPTTKAKHGRAKAADPLPPAMTPQGMLVQIAGTPQVWTTLQMAISAAGALLIDKMGPSIRKAVQQNQIFTVISVNPATPDPLDKSQNLFDFSASDLTIGDWTFNLSPGGLAGPAPDHTPPIFMMKFYPGVTIQDLVNDTRLWSQPETFNSSPDKVQAYLQKVIADAKASVFPNGQPQPDKDSLYWNFYQTVTDPAFNGILAVNCNMELNLLPAAIRAVLGGMTDPGIAGFRVHHVGVAINNTSPKEPKPKLARSAMFALVDYEKTPTKTPQSLDVGIKYNFEVEYLRALFTNSELRSFSCQIDLTINNLFDTEVNQEQQNTAAQAKDGKGNVITIMGSYQAHSNSNDDSNSGQGIYSFVASGNFVYDFVANNYLKKITLTKLQFSFDQETATKVQPPDGKTTRIQSHFGIWGSIEFNELKVLDIFSFEKLEFSNLGIDVGFDLTIYNTGTGKQPSTADISLSFAPGDLRLDLGATETRNAGGNGLLSLIPFKLKSFLYSQDADETLESLDFYSLSTVAGLAENGIALSNNFTYALIFDLDLGSMGGLVGSLSAFKFSMLIGWLSPAKGGNVAFGVQLPQVDGKLEIKIEGVLTISIEQFNLEYATGADPKMLVLGMHNCYIEVLGTRIPPKGTISIGLFAPTEGADQIGWIGAYNLGEDGGGGGKDPPALAFRGGDRGLARQPSVVAEDGGGGSSDDVFKLVYLGIGQRVGPPPSQQMSSFSNFLDYMQGPFWDALKAKEYSKIYHPDGKWIIVTDFVLLKVVEVGFVFYDVTPFYALQLKIIGGGTGSGFSFEITYTKISDTIGLFATSISLPDSLRTFQVGVASVTLPTLSVDVYTNGNWKVDLGFPDGDNWSVCFQVQAMAGPVPVTGSGGFYIAYLSSATNPDVFKGTYATIEGFGFAVRLGVGKDFTAGPLKAGVSVTFFGIIQGAAGYLTSNGGDIFQTPDALSLQGQFGIIGELYGSIDFVIIKASVNVRLQASIGIILALEPPSVPGGGNGSILLYIEASVSVSVSVEINLFLFSITISFSFQASFRFEWQLVGSSGTKALAIAGFKAARMLAAPPALGLCPGLPAALPLMYLPELTVVFPDATNPGAPWAALSLGVQYDPAPEKKPKYKDFKPFEAVATQLTTFALMHALNLPSYDAVVTLNFDTATNTPGLIDIDSEPALLTGWIGYADVLGQLANFAGTVALPTADAKACVFPMPPFLTVTTKGRMVGGVAADISYQFQAQNAVPQSYLSQVDTYFNQLFVNQTQGPPPALARDDALTPLSQEIFLDYFKGLIRGAVHQLLVTMQNQGMTSAKLTDLFSAVAGAPEPTAQSLYQQLAGQMSSAFRSGVRLPYTPGLTVPGGTALKTTNPLYALLWQEFPAGGFGASGNYTITLSNTDTSQTWLTANVPFTLESGKVGQYAAFTESSVARPGSPTAINPTSIGPQSFAFQSAIVWTPPTGAPLSLRPFPPSLSKLQLGQGTDAISVLVQSRAADGPYLPDGTALPAGNITFATSINLTVKQVPGSVPGSVLPDVFALSGASQSDEALLDRILADLRAGDRPVAAIQILYQTSANAPGLVSATVDPSAVFVLRTNTTSVSQPPPGFAATVDALPPGVAVGATSEVAVDGGYGFIQIVQQATVTNASGYYLRFIDTSGHSLPTALFVKGIAQVTLLVSYKPGTGTNKPGSPLAIEPYHNAVVLAATEKSLVYYTETTDPALAIRYIKNAAGTFGVSLSRPDSTMLLKATPAIAASAKLAANAMISRHEAIKALRAAGTASEQELDRSLVAMGSPISDLNKLYALVTFQVQASAGFIASNLSAPLQPQKPTDQDTASDYRVFAPLYNVAVKDAGNRYASIKQPFTLDFFTNDAFGNQLPTPLAYNDTNLYFDPIVPLDQWMGIVPTFDFGRRDTPATPNVINLRLLPSKAAFDGMSADQIASALTNFQTIYNQITAPGVSFYVETSLALGADGTSLVSFPVSVADTAKVVGMVAAIVAWLTAKLAGQDPVFPGQEVTISMAVTGPGELPPLFEIAVLFGIMRDPQLISPYLKDQFGTIIFPAAQNVATVFTPATGGANNMSTFAGYFVAAFPAQKLAVGLNGANGSAPQHMSSTALARKRLKSLKLANDGSGGARSGAQSIWAAAASLLDISIGAAPQTGPRYLSPKPLDNALNSASVPLPTMPPGLPSLPAQRQFLDVDLDQLNRAFFQTVDNVLGPAYAAQTFERARSSYDAIARGRETLAQKYSSFEVDWLFGAQSPFTGGKNDLTAARKVFEQQMRAALMTAYSVDTIVQYDVAWNKPVSPAADDFIELFGQIEAMLLGSYTWSGPTVTATTPNPHGLQTGDRVLMVFTAVPSDATPPPTGVYAVTYVSDTSFTIAVVNGSGAGTFVGTRQNAGLSTAHVAVNSAGTSPLTFTYGDPDIAGRAAIVPFDLRFNVTNLQYFLAPPGAEGEARPSIWLQLIDPYKQPGVPHVGPPGALTQIPVVYRQYPTPPTLVSQSWANYKPEPPSGNPIADGADWSYLYTYQAFLTPHDQINSAITYNTDLSAAPSNLSAVSSMGPESGPPYNLFTALARTSAVSDAIQTILQKLDDPNWTAAIAAFAACVGEVTANTDWNPPLSLAVAGSLATVTDNYVVTDELLGDLTTQQIQLRWPANQGESSFANVTLALTALDPTGKNLAPYPNQRPITPTEPNSQLYEVDDAPIGGLGVAHLIEVDALNVLAAENALAAVQVERNLITLDAPDGTPWQVVPEFVYMTPQVRPSQPVTPYIDNATPIDVTTLPNQGSGAACPSSPSSLCQRIYTIMADLLADPVQARSLLAAHVAAGVTSGTTRRVNVACSYRFPIPSVTEGAFDNTSINPLVPVVLARSFNIDGHQPAQIGDFSALFAEAIDTWARKNAIVYGSQAKPPGAMLIFDITLYAALSGADTPVLRFGNLQLKLTDIDPI